jgi:hypothetical protein
LELASTIQILGNLGEFIGSLVVLITLVYLAVQVRQSKDLLEENRKLALSQVYQGRADVRTAIHREIAASAELAALVGRIRSEGVEIVADLEIPDKTKLENLYQAWAVHIENTVLQTDLGLFESNRARLTGSGNFVIEVVNVLDAAGGHVSPLLRTLWDQITED